MVDNNDSRKVDVLAELLSGGADPGPTDEAEDLNPLLYRDKSEVSKPRYRSFRLTDLDESPGQYAKNILLSIDDPEPEEQYRSFRLAVPLNKKKATVYFPAKLHNRLKSAKYHIKKLAPEEYKSQISMSDIVAISLRIALREFEMKGDQSLMLKLILKHLSKQDQG